MIITSIRAWLERRQRQAINNAYVAGFDDAAAALLRGVSPRHLEDVIDAVSGYSDEQDAYDAGVVCAIREWGLATSRGGR